MPEGAYRKRFGGERCEADKGPHSSGLNSETESRRRQVLRWSPAPIHGELGGEKGTYNFMEVFRVDWWWS